SLLGDEIRRLFPALFLGPLQSAAVRGSTSSGGMPVHFRDGFRYNPRPTRASKTEELRMERTLIILKPDAVQRGLVGEIITRFERKGIQIVGVKFMKIAPALAEQHYAPHKGKPFYEGLVKFMTSSPVLVMAL